MQEVYVFFVDGFEEIEGLTVVDLLRRAEVPVKMVGVSGEAVVTGSHGITVHMDMALTEVKLEKCRALVLPGGPGTDKLGASAQLMTLLKNANEAKLLIGAICAAPSILGDAGILEDRAAVCYPGYEARLTGAEVLKAPVAISEHIITSQGMGTAIPFGLALVKYLCGNDKAEQIKESIVYS